MKKIIFAITIIFAFSFALPVVSFAQGMMGFINSSPDSAAIQSQKAEEQEGKSLLDELTDKTTVCSQLKDADFEKIGEYFMGQSIGDTLRHIVMDEMMKRMMGEQGEEQAHIVMGKRLSGCDTSVAFPSQDAGFIPIMGMMGNWASYGNNGNYNLPYNFGSMMGFGYGYGWGWIFMILWWALVIAGIVALIKWLIVQSRDTSSHDKKTPLGILKERYAKGEINKEEFEEKFRQIKD